MASCWCFTLSLLRRGGPPRCCCQASCHHTLYRIDALYRCDTTHGRDTMGCVFRDIPGYRLGGTYLRKHGWSFNLATVAGAATANVWTSTWQGRATAPAVMVAAPLP